MFVSFCGPCSFVLLFPNFFLAKVTAVFSLFFGQGFIYGILPGCSFFIIRIFFIFASSACSFCFGVCFFFPCLQDWWVDQHGASTWHVPAKVWYKAKRYTDWAQESLSGPVGVEDFFRHLVTCLHYLMFAWGRFDTFKSP